MILKIAFRNILRNARRSATTLAAILAGAVALLLFGAFMAQVILGFQTSTVQRTGHLTLFKTGYFEFGTGDPGAYSITNYANVMAAAQNDPVLKPMLRAMTPSVILLGIAGNADANASKTFFGLGVVPSDRSRMRLWDEYQVMDAAWRDRMTQSFGLSDAEPTHAAIGVGLARLLGLCDQLAACSGKPGSGISSGGTMPRINLLAATTGGAPNILSLSVAQAAVQGQKEVDDSFVAMHLSAAQHLLFGSEQDKVTSIVFQLNRTEDIEAARRRLESIVRQNGFDLEVRTFLELTPMYTQAVAMFRSIFGFIAVIIGTIALFIVANTMSMNVIERTDEIGVSRAIGARRGAIRRLFLAEGCILGVFGATAGVVLAILFSIIFNHAGFTWTPPGQTAPIPLRLLLSGAWTLIAGTWLGLVGVATVAAVIPAGRAARMNVVDALRHV